MRVPAEVLKWINAERKAMGRPAIRAMMKGTYYTSSNSCPIATSLGRNGVRVVPNGYYWPKHVKFVPFPDFMKAFELDINRGLYPQLLGAKE